MKRLAVTILWVAGFLLVAASLRLNASFDSDGEEVTTVTKIGLPSSPLFVRISRNGDTDFRVNFFSRSLLAVLGAVGCCYLANRLDRGTSTAKQADGQKDPDFAALV